MNESLYTPEQKKKSEIDLSNLSVNFESEENLQKLLSEREKIEEYEEWLVKNKELLEKNEKKILRAVEMGILRNSDPRAIYEFEVNRLSKESEGVIKIKNQIEKESEKILRESKEKLKFFLPNWKIPPAEIRFSIYKRADFRVDRNVIYVDLGRLANDKDPIEKVIQGITHEIFHIWMGELDNWSDSKQNQTSDQELKDRIIFKTIDEGLAVLVSGHSLKNFHEERGKDYSNYRNESFDQFKSFLQEKDRLTLIKTKIEAFRSMGHFYVVGYEIVKSILEKEGLTEFKELLLEARQNPEIFLEKYDQF